LDYNIFKKTMKLFAIFSAFLLLLGCTGPEGPIGPPGPSLFSQVFEFEVDFTPYNNYEAYIEFQQDIKVFEADLLNQRFKVGVVPAAYAQEAQGLTDLTNADFLILSP
jgi:hypothetical protein